MAPSARQGARLSDFPVSFWQVSLLRVSFSRMVFAHRILAHVVFALVRGPNHCAINVCRQAPNILS